MNKKGVMVKDAKILLLGIMFKGNCSDIRNTKVVDIYHTLEECSKDITVYNPWANAGRMEHESGIALTKKKLMSEWTIRRGYTLRGA